MNHYENEIAERLKHHLMRKENNTNTNTASGTEASADSSSPVPVEESGGVAGRAAAATGNVARVEEGSRSSPTELAEASAAGTATAVVQCDVR